MRSHCFGVGSGVAVGLPPESHSPSRYYCKLQPEEPEDFSCCRTEMENDSFKN